MRLVIEAEGYVAAAAADAAPALVVALGPEALAAAARGEEHFLRSVHVTGNARLADEVLALARHLRWDYEEDLSRVFGDVIAHRIGEGVRALSSWRRDATARLAGALADYLSEESELLAHRADLDRLSRATIELRDSLERLEQRIHRLG